MSLPVGAASRGRRAREVRPSIVVSLAMVLVGCSTSLPHFESTLAPDHLGPRVSDIVNQIQCEILGAVREGKTRISPLAGLQKEQLVASVDLTLDVTNKGGVNPSLAFIHPLSAADTNFTLGIQGQFGGERHRNMHLAFTLLVASKAAEEEHRECSAVQDRNGLRGDLGIAEIIATGLPYQDSSRYFAGELFGKVDGKDPPEGAVLPSFGSTIDFTLVFGVRGGPSWTLTHFHGVGSDDGFLSYLRTDKDTLILAFAVVPPVPPEAASAVGRSAADVAVQAAGRAAMDNITRQILNRLNIR